jgi:hypothetical protein
MTKLLFNQKKFELLDFDSEAEFEKAVIQNSKHLFGRDTLYIDIKRRIGDKNSYHKTIPDGFLIDFSSKKRPRLYFIENELSTHDAYGHIAEQLLRFSTSIKTSPKQIRTVLIETIYKDEDLVNSIKPYFKEGGFKNVDQLVNFLVDNKIKIVMAINEFTTDLNMSLAELRNTPDTVVLQRYWNGSETLYLYEPMREELSEIETGRTVSSEDFDTIVCPAFEEGFNHAYVHNDAWWAIRISQKAREQLKYLAIYEKMPVAEVRNVAEIEKIEPYKDSGKFIVHLKNKTKVGPIELDKDKKGVAPQSPRYTTYDKLLKSKKISELWA